MARLTVTTRTTVTAYGIRAADLTPDDILVIDKRAWRIRSVTPPDADGILSIDVLDRDGFAFHADDTVTVL